MSTIAYESIVILLLIIFNGLLAMSEIAVVSARRIRLQQRAGSGDAGASAALELKDAPNRFLSTVQIGITLVGILAGAFGGVTIAEQISFRLAQVSALAPYREAISLGGVVLVITYLSLVIGELVPKRLGLSHAEGLAARMARPMRLLSVIAAPAVRALSFSTDAVLRLLRVRPSAEPPITEEEIKVMIRQGAEVGILDPSEQDLMINVFRLGDRRVNALMTPRREMVWLDINDPPDELRRKLLAHPHTRFPVGDGSLDHVLGAVRAKELLALCLAGQPIDPRATLRRPLFVPENLPALKVLEAFKQTGMHMAIVVDEHGGTQGLVTHHDIMEAIVGEIPAAGLPTEPLAIRREDGSWLMDGALPIDEFKHLLGLKQSPGEERGNYQTLAGWVLALMGRIPVAGEHFEWRGLRIEVMEMDRQRVDKVLIEPVHRGNTTPVNSI